MYKTPISITIIIARRACALRTMLLYVNKLRRRYFTTAYNYVQRSTCVLHIYVVPYKSDAHVHLSYAIVDRIQIKHK